MGSKRTFIPVATACLSGVAVLTAHTSVDALEITKLEITPSAGSKVERPTGPRVRGDRIDIGPTRYLFISLSYKGAAPAKKSRARCRLYNPIGQRSSRSGWVAFDAKDGGVLKDALRLGPLTRSWLSGPYRIRCEIDQAGTKAYARRSVFIRPLTVPRLARWVRPSVVAIFRGSFRKKDPASVKSGRKECANEGFGGGSGFIIRKSGYIVTNSHVVRSRACIKDWPDSKIEVRLSDGRRFPAKLVGHDPVIDIAVLKIDCDCKLQPARFGPFRADRAVRVGEPVVAVGFGLLFFIGGSEPSVVRGIVNAQRRSSVLGKKGQYVLGGWLLQHSAATNPGHSGAAMFNMRGEVIAVNRAGFSGLDVKYAIHWAIARYVTNLIIRDGKITRADLGLVRLNAVDHRGRYAHPRAFSRIGLLVDEVRPGSLAYKAGIRQCDLILGHFSTRAGRSNVRRLFPIRTKAEFDVYQIFFGQLKAVTLAVVKATPDMCQSRWHHDVDEAGNPEFDDAGNPVRSRLGIQFSPGGMARLQKTIGTDNLALIELSKIQMIDVPLR